MTRDLFIEQCREDEATIVRLTAEVDRLKSNCFKDSVDAELAARVEERELIRKQAADYLRACDRVVQAEYEHGITIGRLRETESHLGAQAAEIERLRSGRGQFNEQKWAAKCAEVTALTAENERLRFSLSSLEDARAHVSQELEVVQNVRIDRDSECKALSARCHAAEARLAAAVGLLQRWAEIAPPCNVYGRELTFVADTSAFLASAQPAAPVRTEDCPIHEPGCSCVPKVIRDMKDAARTEADLGALIDRAIDGVKDYKAAVPRIDAEQLVLDAWGAVSADTLRVCVGTELLREPARAELARRGLK